MGNYNTTITKEKVVGHFKTITKHKMMVTDLCLRVGLTKQGLMHDLTKYEPIEFLTGAKYFTGDHSPNADEKRDKGYSDAWLHHKGINKHHHEYWMDLQYADPKTGRLAGVGGAKMPLRYVLEMACDRIGACKVYHKDAYKPDDPWKYYLRTAHVVAPTLHKETKALLEDILELMAKQGEKKALAFMRWLLLHPEVYENTEYKKRSLGDHLGQRIEEEYTVVSTNNLP